MASGQVEMGSYVLMLIIARLTGMLTQQVMSQFQSVISNVGKPTYSDNLFFLTNARGKSMYLARIPMMSHPAAAYQGENFRQ